MVLNDVWRSINSEIGVFWKGRFDRVPAASGVYAWFYPLRIRTTDFQEFVTEIQTVMMYESNSSGPPEAHLVADFSWHHTEIDLRNICRARPLPSELESVWKGCCSDEELFKRLRRAVYKASILMPPLYIGKSSNLRSRCGQHLAGTSQSGFCQRFESYARETRARCHSVSDLIFVCSKTEAAPPPAAEETVRGDRIEEVVEEILKRMASPPYGKR